MRFEDTRIRGFPAKSFRHRARTATSLARISAETSGSLVSPIGLFSPTARSFQLLPFGFLFSVVFLYEKRSVVSFPPDVAPSKDTGEHWTLLHEIYSYVCFSSTWTYVYLLRTVIDIRLWPSQGSHGYKSVSEEKRDNVKCVERTWNYISFTSPSQSGLWGWNDDKMFTQTTANLSKADTFTESPPSTSIQGSPTQNLLPSSLSTPPRHWRSFSPSRATSTLNTARDSCRKDSATLLQDDKSLGTRWAPLYRRAAKAASSSFVHQRGDVAVAATFYAGCRRTTASSFNDR